MLKAYHVFWLLLSVIPFVITRSGSLDNYGRGRNNKPVLSEGVSAGDALFLTPYIVKGELDKGRNLSTVPPLLKDIESFAGYLTVNKTTGSNLFFWLFKSLEGDWKERPLVIWLQGGPGSSSLFGLFKELGPFSVTKNQSLKRRKYSWNQKYNLVFFDNPVGAGFSFTKMDSGYARYEVDVAKDLYEAIVQLYKLFPNLQKNKLIIAGESYAGKYVTAVAYRVYKINKVVPFKINLGGLMLGNAFIDPLNMMNHASYLYGLGLIDKNFKSKLLLKEEAIRANVRAGNFAAAADNFIHELGLINSETGISYFDFINDDVRWADPDMEFINDPKTRKAIHVGENEFNDGLHVRMYLRDDIARSVKPWIEEMLAAEEFPILFYSGQLDIAVAYPLSVDFFNTLRWPYAYEYHNAKRCRFKVNNDVAGYYKRAGSFIEVLVRNAGHMVPFSQPEWAFELLDRFITNSTSFKCE